jgi:hypothetical protein
MKVKLTGKSMVGTDLPNAVHNLHGTLTMSGISVFSPATFLGQRFRQKFAVINFEYPNCGTTVD